MTIRLKDETEKQLIASIPRFFREEMEEEYRDLKARLVLDYCLKEIAPSVYNRAIGDAQAFVQARFEDMEATCWKPELGYWTGKK
jgi:uncharacterized protein (DUF2164 family)